MSEPNTPGSQRPGAEIIREFEDRGIQWLFEDPENLRGLLQISEPSLAAQMDFGRAERVNRTFVPADLRKKESDLIFRVPFRVEGERDARDVWVYVLLEHQSEPDPLMGLRLLLYMGQLWDLQRRGWENARATAAARRLHPIVPMVLYTGEDPWNGPIGLESLMDLPIALDRFLPRWETLFLNLHETPPETLTQVATAIGWALRVLQVEKAPRSQIEQVLTEAMAGLEGLTEEQAGQWVRVASFLLQLIFHRREEMDLINLVLGQARQSKFREKDEVEGVGMTIVEQVAAEAEARGAESELRLALKTVLTSRFGNVPPDIEATVDAASVEAMRSWLSRAAKADALEEVGIQSVEPPN